MIELNPSDSAVQAFYCDLKEGREIRDIEIYD